MKCPGQDRAYWKGDRVFELPCPRCGSAVEFFRDENARRCSRCGYRFNNARVALDCAAWCDQAESCLGISRKGAAPVGDRDAALAGRMIEALEVELSHDPAKFTQALLVFQQAKELLPAVGGSARVVLLAALLLELDEDDAAEPSRSAAEPQSAGGGGSRVRELLSRAGLDGETIRDVCVLIAEYHAHCEATTTELAVLRDSCRLARLVQEGVAGDPERLESLIADEIRTDAGKARARNLFNGPGRT
jgi:ribosomal protein S27AE